MDMRKFAKPFGRQNLVNIDPTITAAVMPLWQVRQRRASPRGSGRMLSRRS
jgi:hypothetical protein